MNEYVLMTYYKKYLQQIRKVSESSINHYLQAIRTISKFLAERGKIQESVYEIQDIGQLEVVKTFLYSDVEFAALDEKGHRMYSVGFNHYIKFANGEGFKNIDKEIELLDMKLPVPKKIERVVSTNSRSSIIKLQSIESVGYKCEYDPLHTTFTAKSTGHTYMEGHHALPLMYQDKFNSSLDVYANVVCLCPVCHRLLHYGVETEKETVVNKIYYDRAERLASSGIRISKNDFYDLVI